MFKKYLLFILLLVNNVMHGAEAGAVPEPEQPVPVAAFLFDAKLLEIILDNDDVVLNTLSPQCFKIITLLVQNKE